MVDELEIPFPLSGFQIDADEALRKEIVARPMSAVVIRRGSFDRQVHQPEIFVDRDLGPDARVAVDRPRFVLPRLATRLAWFGNRVELPNLPAGPHVERTNQTF